MKCAIRVSNDCRFHYLEAFLLFLCLFLYLTVLLLQGDPTGHFQSVHTIASIMAAGWQHDSAGGGGGAAPPLDADAAFSTPAQALSWLREGIVRPIWTPRVCGDGACQSPYEYPAYGRFGCEVDCGRADTQSVAVVVSTDFAGLDFSDAAVLLSMCE